MRIIKVTDYDEVSVRTANMILGQVNLKPDAVLGLGYRWLTCRGI